ncbi:hypothetical protein ACF1A5_04720 [Streptomyces sp. NPDC014864]|uniref:hypothetical protein n=1 Tax=Streptomyces sp. NPDC014864 TaxID=3364924 RepID=UPI0036FB5331
MSYLTAPAPSATPASSTASASEASPGPEPSADARATVPGRRRAARGGTVPPTAYEEFSEGRSA